MKNYRLLIYLLIFSILITGCSARIPFFSSKNDEPVSNLSGDALLTNGQEIYNATLDLINSAQKTIYIEQSAFEQPTIKEKLIEKARSGLEIKILLDQFQKVNKSTMDELKSENISVQYYPAQKGQDHRVKLLVVDHSQAIIYGPAWTEKELNSPNLAVKLTEKSAWKTAYSVFATDWKNATTLSLNIPNSTDLPDDVVTLARNANIKPQILQQINNSQSQIVIELGELTSDDIARALIEAAGNGVQVQVILASQSSAQLSVIENLKKNGIAVRFYPADTNRQLAVFDQKCFIISSSGWTYSAFVINHELSITVPSPAASEKLLGLFFSDWEISTESVPAT